MSYFITRVFQTEFFYSTYSRYGNEKDKKHIFDRQFFAFDMGVDNGAIILRSPGSDESFECEFKGELGEIKYPMVLVADEGEVSTFPWGSFADSALLFADTRSVVSETSLARAPLRSQCSHRSDQPDGH